jgi:hypothetical protein
MPCRCWYPANTAATWDMLLPDLGHLLGSVAAPPASHIFGVPPPALACSHRSGRAAEIAAGFCLGVSDGAEGGAGRWGRSALLRSCEAAAPAPRNCCCRRRRMGGGAHASSSRSLRGTVLFCGWTGAVGCWAVEAGKEAGWALICWTGSRGAAAAAAAAAAVLLRGDGGSQPGGAAQAEAWC